jgi:hypothetical protein
MTQLLALESNTENSGTYTFKPGYHSSRADNLANWPSDYSIRDAVDKLGASDTSAAGDWTHLAAKQGDYRSMDKYGERLERAFEDRDPRLAGWREALGQTDLDATPEGLDFRNWTRRTPDSTHAWHWHFSESRAYAEDYDNKRALLSVLKGETLDAYLAGGGKLLAKNGSGVINVALPQVEIGYEAGWTEPAKIGNRGSRQLLDDLWGQELYEESPYVAGAQSARTKRLVAIEAQAKANGVALTALTTKVDAMQRTLDAILVKFNQAAPSGGLTTEQATQVAETHDGVNDLVSAVKAAAQAVS